MNILVTNDDGINCEGLLLLAEALRGLSGHTVFVLAPEDDRSGVSQSISLKGPLRLRDRGNNTWTCSGTPADCVMVAALGGLPEKPDLVVSGINAGANLGTDLVYSGTAAAARQAALYGIPGVAFSLVTIGKGPVFWERAVEFSRDHLEELVSLWEKDTFVNVNIPNSPDYSGDPQMTVPSRRLYRDTVVGFDAPDGSRYCFIKNGPVVTDEDPGSDWSAVSRNRVAISLVFIHPVVRS
ncbi:MAG: 5'/3'-nucleotidase SurE [Treponema sp.]|nr:5'/3'-nucleotidase SurE [Treponema sp.]